MQCFQKDPRLRVSARKLLKHAWVMGSRRGDAPAPKPPANYSETVDKVKQWNEALKSPTNSGSLKSNSRSSAASPMPSRKDAPLRSVHNDMPIHNALTKGALHLATPRAHAEAFRSPENNSRCSSNLVVFVIETDSKQGDDDNWDDDFATSISPSALHLPHLKPHDNFGGMFSSDRLKSYASMELASDSQNENWDENFEGDLMTIKPFQKRTEPDPHELDTIRPSPARRVVSTEVKKPGTDKGHNRTKSAAVPQKRQSNLKDGSYKFELPTRPAALFREQTVEDYSDLFLDDVVIDRRLSLAQKVSQYQMRFRQN